MRIRTIKPEFFTHEGLFQAEKESGLPLRVAFAGLWCVADREGRFKWEPRRIGLSVLPYDGHEFSSVLDALSTRGFIVKYASGPVEYGYIPSFKTHQVVNHRESQSVLPEPPKKLAERVAIQGSISRVEHASGTREARGPGGKEGNGKEGVLETTREGRVPDASTGVDKFTLDDQTCEPPPKPRNELLDALVSLDGTNPLTATSPLFVRAAKALQIIREVSPDVTAEEILMRAKNYTRLLPGAERTSTAIAAHWSRCEAPHVKGRNKTPGIPNI